MSFVLFAWIASIVYGVYAITAKLISTYQLKNVAHFSFFSLLFGGLTIAGISLLNGAAVPTDWTFIILAGLSMALGGLLYIASLKNLDISVLTPLFNIRVVITVLLGFLFLGEALTLENFFFIGIIVLGGIVVSMDEKFSIRSFFSKNIGLGLLYMCVLSIETLFINRAISQAGYWTAMLWIGLLAIVFAFVLLYARFKEDFAKSKPKDYLGVGILALIGGVGDLAAYKAFEGNVGISSAIISLPISMVFAFILSRWKPGLLEKHPLKVYVLRFVAVTIMITSALKLSN